MVIDLLICEVDLQDRSGLSLLRHIRRNYPVKVFGMSATGSMEEISLTTAAGFDRLFVKPVEFSNLEAEIREVLPRPGDRPTAPQSDPPPTNLPHDLRIPAVAQR